MLPEVKSIISIRHFHYIHLLAQINVELILETLKFHLQPKKTERDNSYIYLMYFIEIILNIKNEVWEINERKFM